MIRKGSVRATKYLYIQSTTVYVPSSELGLPQPPVPQAMVPPPPPAQNQRVGGGTLACRWGVGESQFRRLEKKLSTLPTLWLEQTDREDGWWTGRVGKSE